MTKYDKIQQLNELQSSLAGFSPQPVYAVPEGYFESLSTVILNRIRAGEAVDAGTELQLISPSVNGISRDIPFTVPTGYFENLQERVLLAIQQQHTDQNPDTHEFAASQSLDPLTGTESEQNRLAEFEMDADHAEWAQTAEEELAVLSPLLGSIAKKNPYHIPTGYFENFENNINLKSGTGAARVVPMKVPVVVPMVRRKWFRYAAAAVVIGFTTLTGIQYLNRNPSGVSNPQAWVEKNLDKVSTNEINNFIQTSDAGATDQNNLATSSKPDMNDLMKDVSDKDIQDFLSKTSATGNEEADADVLLN